jgi:hypothetical protein
MLGRIQMIQMPSSSFVFPAKAGTHFADGHRPPVPCQGQASPVWRSFLVVALVQGRPMDRLNEI